MTEPPLTADILLQAYAAGIFPMAESQESTEVFWVDPKRRGVLPLDGFHISRSLARALRRGDYSISLDRGFADVVSACADRPETWINRTIFDLYLDLHRTGWAHSLEVWEGKALIGGVYGVAIGAAFFGESMFSRRRDGSKIALAYLVDHLRRSGFQLFDTQFITPHLATLGGIEISRSAYRQQLAIALQKSADFQASTAVPSAQDVLQRNTQTS